MRIGRFLGLEDTRDTSPQLVDSFILSNVLNYVDYKEVLNSLVKYLKPNGRIFINNIVNNGYSQYFSDKRPIERDDIEKHMESLGFRLEDAVEKPIGLKENMIRVFVRAN